MLCKDNLIQLLTCTCTCIFICNSVALFYSFVNFIVGKIMDTQSNLYIGKSDKFQSFKGYIDEVSELLFK